MKATCKLGEKGCWNDGKCRAAENCVNKIVTNADRIRSMSDEELAVLLDDFGACSRCRRNGNDCFPVSNTLDWLKQPVKEDE